MIGLLGVQLPRISLNPNLLEYFNRLRERGGEPLVLRLRCLWPLEVVDKETGACDQLLLNGIECGDSNRDLTKGNKYDSYFQRGSDECTSSRNCSPRNVECES